MGEMSRLRAAAGLIGPAAFTAAWVAAARRQNGYRVSHEHISGLAARDATDRHVMSGGFLALGACTVVFASELERRLGGRGRAGWGPTLMGLAGVGTVVAGVFPRDRRLNARPGVQAEQSWVNDVHDSASVAGAVSGLIGLAALARRFRRDPAWSDLATPAARTAAVSGASTAWFLRDVVRPGNGIVQRVSVSLPLAFMARLAGRALRVAGQEPSAESGTSSRVRSTSSAIAATSSSSVS
jgi:hypothetical protein